MYSNIYLPLTFSNENIYKTTKPETVKINILIVSNVNGIQYIYCRLFIMYKGKLERFKGYSKREGYKGRLANTPKEYSKHNEESLKGKMFTISC